eukprot:CAMPEP_0184389128 /NCGR_PEP_ID=MMETSP0007-20130409/12207_1 /TAXON_ID=97485 /ORGANISM="Prymnesium parvum, Strain Texoma1" /LENGTH=105 /DNA_ID=CAMNT_0026738295 /DNA_START=501 /DNA_END=818 /DNA_ORIENTATION=-
MYFPLEAPAPRLREARQEGHAHSVPHITVTSTPVGVSNALAAASFESACVNEVAFDCLAAWLLSLPALSHKLAAFAFLRSFCDLECNEVCSIIDNKRPTTAGKMT